MWTGEASRVCEASINEYWGSEWFRYDRSTHGRGGPFVNEE